LAFPVALRTLTSDGGGVSRTSSVMYTRSPRWTLLRDLWRVLEEAAGCTHLPCGEGSTGSSALDLTAFPTLCSPVGPRRVGLTASPGLFLRSIVLSVESPLRPAPVSRFRPRRKGCRPFARSAHAVPPDFSGFLLSSRRRFIAPCCRSCGSSGCWRGACPIARPSALAGPPRADAFHPGCSPISRRATLACTSAQPDLVIPRCLPFRALLPARRSPDHSGRSPLALVHRAPDWAASCTSGDSTSRGAGGGPAVSGWLPTPCSPGLAQRPLSRHGVSAAHTDPDLGRSLAHFFCRRDCSELHIYGLRPLHLYGRQRASSRQDAAYAAPRAQPPSRWLTGQPGDVP
jgi:hypothetical protein